MPAKTDEPETRFIYRIDEDDCLTHVCPNWIQFARDNNAPELSESNLIGTQIWRYIADADCSDVYRAVFARVRETGHSTRFHFRCDSPDTRRDMEMNIARIPAGHLEFQVRIVDSSKLPWSPWLDPQIEKNERWVTLCAWCKRIENRDTWLEPTDAVDSMRLFMNEKVPNVTHGICPDCLQNVMQQISENDS